MNSVLSFIRISDVEFDNIECSTKCLVIQNIRHDYLFIKLSIFSVSCLK